MLSTAKFGAGLDPVGYYLEIVAAGRDDYYLAPGEAHGRWVGSAATALGLDGEVSPEDLRAMLEGRDPRTGAQLVGWREIQGFDLTLSAPKSVSLLWGLGDNATAVEVVAAHDEAVLAAIAYLEAEACTVRRGREGRLRFPGIGIVAAAFRHRTSRASDPNLHAHLVTGNMTRGPDDRWSALFTTKLYGHGRTAGFVYQSVLRHELASRLGVSFEPAVNGAGEIVGIPMPVRRAFSRRRVAIEKAMVEHGVRTAHGAEIATLDTRPTKPQGVSEIDLRANWLERASELDFGVDAVPRRGDSGLAHVAVRVHRHQATGGQRSPRQDRERLDILGPDVLPIPKPLRRGERATPVLLVEAPVLPPRRRCERRLRRGDVCCRSFEVRRRSRRDRTRNGTDSLCLSLPSSEHARCSQSREGTA